MANTEDTGRVRCVTGNATTTEVNAGKIIVPPDASRAYIITGGWLRALGGNAGGATSVNISDTTGTPVVGLAVAVGTLTQDAVVDFNLGANITKTTYGTAHTKGKGLQIIANGTLTTATSVDYCVKYKTI
jgi:hypothetical protein